MGHDYSYSKPSSSEEYDLGFACLLQAEAYAYPDESESSHNVAEPVQYPPQPECDDGIPKTCYCGAEPVVATSYTSKDPGRRYFTCENVDDGDCHVWKRFDVAAMEEFSDFRRQLRQLKDQSYEIEHKLVTVEKRVSEHKRFVCELKKKSQTTNGFALAICVMVSALVFIGLADMFLTRRASKK